MNANTSNTIALHNENALSEIVRPHRCGITTRARTEHAKIPSALFSHRHRIARVEGSKENADEQQQNASVDLPFDGDVAWRVSRTLKDGTPVMIRPVLPEDREELRNGLIALSPESRYFRFLHAGTGLTPSEDLLTYLTEVDQKDHVAIGAVIASPDLKTERGIGIARFIRLPARPDTAEAAVTVADDMHRRGVGGILLRELLRAARARGIRIMRAEVLAENATMRAILERSGAVKVESDPESGTLAYDLPIAPPSSEEAPHDEEHDNPLFEILRAAAETMAFRFKFRKDGWFVK
jgi:RimJ/RimL family protein N-acetyltransferase